MSKILQFFRALAMLIVVPLLTLLISLLAILWIVVLRLPTDTVHKMVRWWGKAICVTAGIKVRVEGAENCRDEQPCIFASNHQSQTDIPALQGYFLANFRWLAKKELFQVPIWGTAMRRAGYIPVDRSHGRQAMKSLDEAARRIAEGTSVLIFPEGTRSKDGTLLPFKAGALLLAIKAGVPLVPVAISGSRHVLPKGKLLIRPGTITIRMGKPIETAGYTPRQKNELAEVLRNEVKKLLEVEQGSS
jgi:1-acyl-sn-glycerol-3-phosphate acyltransferase